MEAARRHYGALTVLIRIGIYTDGEPRVSRGAAEGEWRVDNAVRGVGFHWREVYRMLLSGVSSVEVLPPREGEPSLVASIDLERYLESVVSSEMSPEAPEEFIKAHAIISRSWAVRMITCPPSAGLLTETEGDDMTIIYDTAAHRGFHLCNDDHCQRFQGMERVSAKARKAVADTAGTVLADRDGNVADARYSKCCGGMTELFSTCWQDRDYHYLQPVADPWCDLSGLGPEERDRILASALRDFDRNATPDFYRWERTVDAAGVSERLRALTGIDIGEAKGLEVVRRGPSGRVSRLRVDGSRRSVTLGKELAIRRLLAADCLLSSAFTVSGAPGGFRLAGKGWGHGAGLCQIGAAAMAAAGHTAEEILAFYYPGTKTVTI